MGLVNDGSSSIPKPDLKFPSSKSNSADLNKWHVISATWSDKGENLSNFWSNSEKLIIFTAGNVKGSYDCCIGDLGKISGWNKTHSTGCMDLPQAHLFHHMRNEVKTCRRRGTLISGVLVFISETCRSCHPH